MKIKLSYNYTEEERQGECAMKIRKGIVTIIIFILSLIISSIFNYVQSAIVSPSLYFGIAEIRTTSNMGYAMGNPSTGSKKIWKMVEYSNSTTTSYTEVNAYCLNAETGFSNAGDKAEYNVSYNMKTDSRTTIASQNNVLNQLVNGGQYDNILALADLLYIKDVSSLGDRENLLETSKANAVVDNSDFNGVSQYYLTDDEIDAVQQAAIWYFTNGQTNDAYNVYNKSWAWYTTSTSNGTYTNYTGYNPTGMPVQAAIGYYRQQQMKVLYNYLVDTAKANASAGINDANTILTLYASDSDGTAQPVMEVTKIPKEFDLSLRKYITAVNDETVSNTRIPNIDLSTLVTGTTATYKHRKDPVEVKTNDIVTYNITIYNEGEKAGRATKIVDQLPTGLEFVEVVSGNFEKSSYSTTNNTLYLTRNASNTTNLPAYSTGNLSSETIQIKCKVTSTGGDTDKILTNIAWISEEIDEDGTVITNQAGADRDSEPSTITTQTKDQLVTTDNGYIGNSSNSGKDLTNSSNYFVGQQDDDDFEKVVVRAVTSIDVSKKWDDEENQDGKRVGTVTVELLRNGVATGQTIILTEGNNWSGTFSNLPTKINGVDVTYSVKETTSITGYDTVVSSADNENGKSFTITNSYTPEETQITVTKKWEDNNNQDGKRPTSVTVELYKNGVATGNTQTISGSNWTATFTGLPVYENGQKITYTVRETVPSGYTSSGDGTEANNYTITNTHKIFDLSLRKYITKVGNTDITNRTPNIDTSDLADGTDTTASYNHRKDPVTVKTGDQVIYNLTIYNEGEKAGRATKIVDQLPTGLTYVGLVDDSIFTVETYDVGTNTIYFIRQDSNTDNLEAYNNGNTLDSETIQIICEVTAEAGSEDSILTNVAWISEEYDAEDDKTITTEEKADTDSEPGTAPNVNKDDLVTTGDDIGYKGDNSNPEDLTQEDTYYKGEQDDDDFEKIVIEARTEITATKEWSDNNNQDGKRPTEVEFELYKNGTATGNKKTLTESNWTATFTDLPVYENGQKITYTVKEVNVPDGYTSSGDGTEENNYTITNEYTPETTEVTVTKQWVDSNNQDNKRPTVLKIELYKKVGNGAEEFIRDATMTGTGNTWAGRFTGLPTYEDGQKITYIVREVNENGNLDEYTSSGDATEENNYTITNTHKIFDLSLRKYITKVGNTDITNRTPNIDTSDLADGTDTTASYNHRKDPVTVKTGDQVIYNLTIYNEGEKVGRATKIVDQLPTGLTYVGLVDDSIFTLETYDTDTNTIHLIRQDSNTENLDAYDGGDTLDSETIQVICEVTANAGSEAITLTNVAWISEEYDAEDDKTITTEEKADTDSEPGTTPDVDKDGLVTTGDDIGYKGDNSNPEDLTQEDTYYKGEQDDDDFEKIIIEPITQVTVYKTWNDENDQDGIRPSTITINLIKDGSVIDHKEMTADSGWTSVTFDNLPKYENGEEITYTVQEEENTGYAIGYSDATYNQETNGYEITITNTHTPGTTSVTVNKVWDDEDNRDGIRPDSVVIELLKNGNSLNPQQTVTLSEENGWSDGFYDLPINENGEEIVYTVRELTQIEGYNTTIVDDSTGEEISNEIASVDKEETRTTTYAGKSMIRATSAETIGTLSETEKAVSRTIENITTMTEIGELTESEEINTIEQIEETRTAGEIEAVEPKNFTITNTHIVEREFDLALRKFIVAVSKDENIEESDILKSEDGTSYAREPVVDASKLNTTDEDGNTITTAIYNHTKEPVLVKKNDIVVYMLRVYNEGEQDGYATEITDYLPPYLEFVDGEYNTQYGWEVSEDGRTVTTRYLENSLIAKPQTEENGNNTLSYVEVPIMCRVSGEANANENITNIADITEYQDENKEPVEDRDSEENNVEVPSDENLPGYKEDEIGNDYVPGQEDDDDFEKVYVQDFDLALRKFISEVDGTQYDRAPSVDLSGLENGTTAIYNHTKDPVLVKRNSVVVYTIRVYNEGNVDGYVEEVTDYLPNELEFLPEHEINIAYEWNVSEDGRTVTTEYLSNAKETEERQNLINAFDGTTLDYKEVKIACRVKDESETNIKLTNLAEITEDSDDDRDSNTDNVEIPNDENLPNYKDDEIDQDYVPGQEDDDDFEKVIVQDFDLALRKFITKVDEEDVTTRIPEISYDREQNQITYNHTKDPVEVITGNVVEYTIRIYNEGDISGYAEEVADDIPDGLKYLPQNATNIEYRWVMYDAEGNITENVDEAVEIRTDYLSKEQEETEGENLLQAFNPEEEIGEGNPDYRDIKIAFEVVEPNTSDRIIVNSAQITEDSDENGNPVEDKDSTPDEWNEGEDDQDKEYIKLTYFDLALRKWVTEAIVIENGQQTVTQTGHTAEMDPEPVVKVELYRKNLNDVVVKFRYSIRITNEGDIAGYATEITDYVPAGLTFLAEDNSGWTDEGNNVISTRLLENTLLQPGESAEVEVLLTWINGEDNMGQMTNIAEISEDYNDKGAPDRDSTPDNQVMGEDDIDDAPVLLSIETGQERIYFVLGFTVLGTLAGGLVLIKRFVI